MKTFLLALVLAAFGCGCDGNSSASKSTNAPAGSDPLSAPADYLRALDKGEKAAVKVVDTASLNQAIQLFNVEHGRNPKDLQELVTEKFLPRIPQPPRGMKIEYDSATGKVRVVPE